jgi:hypothetical protein
MTTKYTKKQRRNKIQKRKRVNRRTKRVKGGGFFFGKKEYIISYSMCKTPPNYIDTIKKEILNNNKITYDATKDFRFNNDYDFNVYDNFGNSVKFKICGNTGDDKILIYISKYHVGSSIPTTPTQESIQEATQEAKTIRPAPAPPANKGFFFGFFKKDYKGIKKILKTIIETFDKNNNIVITSYNPNDNDFIQNIVTLEKLLYLPRNRNYKKIINDLNYNLPDKISSSILVEDKLNNMISQFI